MGHRCWSCPSLTLKVLAAHMILDLSPETGHRCWSHPSLTLEVLAAHMILDRVPTSSCAFLGTMSELHNEEDEMNDGLDGFELDPDQPIPAFRYGLIWVRLTGWVGLKPNHVQSYHTWINH